MGAVRPAHAVGSGGRKGGTLFQFRQLDSQSVARVMLVLMRPQRGVDAR